MDNQAFLKLFKLRIVLWCLICQSLMVSNWAVFNNFKDEDEFCLDPSDLEALSLNLGVSLSLQKDSEDDLDGLSLPSPLSLAPKVA